MGQAGRAPVCGRGGPCSRCTTGPLTASGNKGETLPALEDRPDPAPRRPSPWKAARSSARVSVPQRSSGGCEGAHTLKGKGWTARWAGPGWRPFALEAVRRRPERPATASSQTGTRLPATQEQQTKAGPWRQPNPRKAANCSTLVTEPHATRVRRRSLDGACITRGWMGQHRPTQHPLVTEAV